MSVDTRAVQGRRKLCFTSFDQVSADAEKLVNSPSTRVLGNWPLPRLLAHLAKAVNDSIDGISAKAPLFIRLIGPFLKGRILTKGIPAGRNLPKSVEASFFPEVGSSREAFEKLQAAVSRTRTERMKAKHPVFGTLSHEEWLQFHLRHAELHLGFALPG
jgi:Protein of unknown function (DUF1569)